MSTRVAIEVPADGLAMPTRIWAVMVLASGTALSVLVSSIANVALPTIAQDLNITPAESIWVVNIYQLVVTSLLLPLAGLGDIVGYRRVYLSGLALFVLGSLACSLSNSFAALTVARAIQGVGGAGIMCVSSALLRSVYPARLLGRGIGIAAMVVATSSAAGPAVASAILSVADWPWIFAINVPVGLVAVVIGLRVLPMNELSQTRFDTPGAILNALTLGLFILGLEGIGHNQTASTIAIELTFAIVIGYFFVRRQMRQPKPLLPLDLLRLPIFSLSVSTAFCSFMAQVLAMVSLPFYLQEVVGLSAVDAGLQLTAWPIAVMAVAPAAGVLADKFSAGVLGTMGLVVSAIGLALLGFSSMETHGSGFSWDMSWRLAICGAGFALFQQPNTRVIVGSAPKERAGGASGLLATTRLSGQTTGAAVAAIVFSVSASGGYGEALKVAMLVALLAAIISALRLVPGVTIKNDLSVD